MGAGDYDLVILGGTSAALKAAITAVNQNARVALVCPEPWEAEISWTREALAEFVGIPRSLRPQTDHRRQVLDQHPSPWQQAHDWIAAGVNALKQHYSPARLAGLGIDVILTAGEFQSRPHLHFQVEGRSLRSRAYLIAGRPPSPIPVIPGVDLCETEWVTHLDKRCLSPNCTIYGDGPLAIQWAQILTRLGTAVTLGFPEATILPLEDEDVSLLLQAQLEAEGVRLFSRYADPEAENQNQEQRSLSSGLEPAILSKTHLHLGQPLTLPEHWLNLRGVGVKHNQQRILVNASLQTSHPQIYACGDIVGGYPLETLATAEAEMIVRAVLSQRWRKLSPSKVNYRYLSWTLASQPELARLGCSEVQARKFYGNQVLVLKQGLPMLDRALLRGEITGFCKLIVHRNGQILGATLLGPGAADGLPFFALAARRRLPIAVLSRLAAGSSSLVDLCCQMATHWQAQDRA